MGHTHTRLLKLGDIFLQRVVVALTEERRREVRRQTLAVPANAVDRRCVAEYRRTQDCMELLQLKRDSDDADEASTPAEVRAAVTVTASVEYLHPADDSGDCSRSLTPD